MRRVFTPNLKVCLVRVQTRVVVDLPLRHLAALGIGIVIAADRREGCVVGASCQHDRKGCKHLGIVVWLEHARVPACAGVELVDEAGAKDVCIAQHQGPLRLR